jgi:hypothetical protein
MEEQRFALELSRRQLDRWEEQEEIDFEICGLLQEELGNEWQVEGELSDISDDDGELSE